MGKFRVTLLGVAWVAALTVTTAVPASAEPAPGAGRPAAGPTATDQALLAAARAYFGAENAVKLDGARGAGAAQAASAVAVAATFERTRDDRFEARAQQRRLNDLAGVRYAGVRTEVAAVGSARTAGRTAALRVREHAAYTFAGAVDDPYSYTVEHDLSFARADGGAWVLARIATREGPAAMATPVRLTPAQLRAAERTAAGLKAALDRDGGTQPTDPARKRTTRPGGVGVADSYDYRAMVDFALKYAEEPESLNVPYERDTNDCTNFISHALAAGGWDEVYGWYRSDAAWWYNFNPWPFPDNHSWTWGGAPNWQRFARDQSKRVFEVGGPESLAIADVVQFEIPGYSPPGQPGHTMMVTDFTPDWMPKMSFHTDDVKNRPLSEILPKYPKSKFWYFRT